MPYFSHAIIFREDLFMKSATQKKAESPFGDTARSTHPGAESTVTCRSCASEQAGLRSDQKSLYQQLLGGLYDAVLITDPNGYVIDANPRVEEFFKYSANETWDIMVGELIAGVNSALLERVRKGLDQGRFILLDAKCVRKDGSTFSGEVSISSIQLVNGGDFVFAVRNVDRRKNAWQKLKSRQNAWTNALAVGVITDVDGVICAVNRAGLKLWGYEAESDLVGKPFAKLWDDDADAVVAAVTSAQGGTTWIGELHAVARDGRVTRVTAALETDTPDWGTGAGALCSALPLAGQGKCLPDD